MNDFDKKLYHDLNLEIEMPKKFTNIIKESLKNDKIKKKVTHYSLAKIVSVACASLVLTAGIAYASSEIVKNIWREPEKVISNNNIITAEEKVGCMTKEEATAKANEIFKKFGYNNEKIETVSLEKKAYKIIDWNFETETGISLSFDAYGKDGFWFFNSNVLKKEIKNYKTTKKEAERTAKEICEKYGYDLSKYTNISIKPNLVEEKDAYIWYVDFKQEYNGTVNNYEEISVAFIPEINEIYYFTVDTCDYENNPIEIKKEEAVNVALGAEKNTKTGYEVKCLDAYLSIEKMNSDAYLRTTDYEKYIEQRNNLSSKEDIDYVVEKHIRKVWKIILLVGEPNTKLDHDITYSYYIDATTGEVIGGESMLCDIYTANDEDGKTYTFYKDCETGKILLKELYSIPDKK